MDRAKKTLKRIVVTIIVSLMCFVASPFVGMGIAALLDANPESRTLSMQTGTMSGIIFGFLITVPCCMIRLIFIIHGKGK